MWDLPPSASFNDGTDVQYYFDMKGNAEHYRMMTNDMTEEEFAHFAELERQRLEELNTDRIVMEKLIMDYKARSLEEQRRQKEEAANKSKINVDKLGAYKSHGQVIRSTKMFQDDDELIMMQIKMDIDDRLIATQASNKQKSI